MLNEFCLNTGYHRKYAIRLLNGAPPVSNRSDGSVDADRAYGPQVLGSDGDLWSRGDIFGRYG